MKWTSAFFVPLEPMDVGTVGTLELVGEGKVIVVAVASPVDGGSSTLDVVALIDKEELAFSERSRRWDTARR